ncbi:MAG: hypothetical protein R3185_07100 [Candidatus Thermoplasmatota archaeon]|nr:hypothetical protein [Candidatus Thermoplasmatota archaeon]
MTNPLQTILLGLLVISTGLAGCLTDTQAPQDQEPPGPGPSDPARPEPVASFSRTACTEHYGAFTMPHEEAEPYLPQGFTMVARSGAPITGPTAETFLLIIHCEGDADHPPATQAWAVLPVDPPEPYNAPDATIQYVVMAGLVTNQTVHDLYASAWGLPRMAQGTATFEASSPTPAAQAWDAELNVPGGRATLSVTIPAAPGPFQGGLVRLFGVEDQQVTGIVDTLWSDQTGQSGAATLQDDGFMPVTVDGDGAGGVYTDFSIDFEQADLPEAA